MSDTCALKVIAGELVGSAHLLATVRMQLSKVSPSEGAKFELLYCPEGAKLAESIRARVGAMRARVDEIAPLVPQAIAAYQAKITERLKEALGAADDDRVRAELALFSAKADVHEELDRLRAHLGEVERSLRQGGPVGKRLDFLAQELNREANTLAAKSSSQQLSDGALELKLLVEQIREQVQNIE